MRRVAEKSPVKFVNISLDEINGTNFKLGLAGKHQKINAKLAITACKEWVFMMNRKSSRVQLNDLEIESGLSVTVWPGRCQTVVDSRYPNVSWYLDGAHTPESLEVTFT